MICDSAAKGAQKSLRPCRRITKMILQRRRHIHYCIYFRVTTLLADSTLPTSHCRPVPHSSGGLFPLTVDIRPRLLGIAFGRSCSQGIANPCLAAVLHNRRLSVSGDTDRSFPVHCIWLMNCYYNKPFGTHLSTLYKALNSFLVMRINFTQFRPAILGQIVNKI